MFKNIIYDNVKGHGPFTLPDKNSILSSIFTGVEGAESAIGLTQPPYSKKAILTIIHCCTVAWQSA